MRVTQNMISNRVLQNLGKNMEQLDKLNYQLSSGKKFEKVSDDPSGVVAAMQLDAAIVAHNRYNANVDQAAGLLNTTEGALQDLTNILHRVRELAVQGANGTLDDTDRQGIAFEIKQLRDQVKSIANLDQGGKYLFGGTNLTTAPWDDTQPAGSEWQGNGEVIKYQVGQSSFIEVNVPGGAIFRDAPPAGRPLMQALDSLISNLENGNIQGISRGISDAQANLDNVLRVRAEIGARVNRLDLTKNRLTDQVNNLEALLSKAQDIDMAQVISQLKAQESTYNAALASGARIIQPTLLDFLK